MTPVTVTDKIGVVLVEADLAFWRNLFISAPDAFAQDPFTCFILRYDIAQSGALRGRIFRGSVVIVKAGPVSEDQIALDLLKAERTIFIQLIVSRLVSVLH